MAKPYLFNAQGEPWPDDVAITGIDHTVTTFSVTVKSPITIRNMDVYALARLIRKAGHEVENIEVVDGYCVVA